MYVLRFVAASLAGAVVKQLLKRPCMYILVYIYLAPSTLFALSPHFPHTIPTPYQHLGARQVPSAFSLVSPLQTPNTKSECTHPPIRHPFTPSSHLAALLETLTRHTLLTVPLPPPVMAVHIGADGEGQTTDYYAATAEYTQRPPSPPFIHIPTRNMLPNRMQLLAPTDFYGVDMGELDPQELALVLGSPKLQKEYCIDQWHYELRRQAQPILDFLFLGPSSSARDVQFLSNNGITMVLGARDPRLAAVRLRKIEQELVKLGIPINYVDVGTPGALIKSFEDAIKIINQHLVDVYRAQKSQLGGADAAGNMDVDSHEPSCDGNPNMRRGKVLVFCETGNDRSAAVVAAYIMAIFRVNLVAAVQFVQGSRFCSIFDEETKQMLATYQGLLEAKRQTARAASPAAAATAVTPSVSSSSVAAVVNLQAPLAAPEPRRHTKRGLIETMDEEDIAMSDMGGSGDMDRDRYVGRNFAPFIDNSPT